MLKGMMKHEDKEHGKTLKHEAPRYINHKAIQNKNNTGTTGTCNKTCSCGAVKPVSNMLLHVDKEKSGVFESL